MRDDKPARFDWSQIIPLALVFGLALALRLWFNFAAGHINNFSSCDASEYLRNADALLNLKNLPAGLWSQCLSVLTGQASADTVSSVKHSLSSLSGFAISGPVFPGLLAACTAIAGGALSPNAWILALCAQSLVSALTCVFVTATGSLCFDRRTGFLAGVLSAFYPAFIVNSGRLYSETFAAFLFSALVWLTVRSFRPAGNSPWLIVLTGFAMASLQLTRSIMVVLTFLLAPLNLARLRGKKLLLAAPALCLGFALVALPWLALQKLAFGSGSLMVDRVGHFNLFIGNNVDTGGFLSYPYPDGTAVEQKSVRDLLGQAIKKSPERWLKLLLDKPARFLKFPWNDFKTAIGPFAAGEQILFHQLILLLAAIGIPLSFAFKPDDRKRDYSLDNRLDSERFAGRLLLVALASFHALYLLFITVPRYNLTVMPLLIIFAAAGVILLLPLLQSHRKLPVAFAIIVSAILLMASQYASFIPLLALVAGARHPLILLAVSCLVKGTVAAAFLASIWKAIPANEGHPAVARALTLALALVLMPVLSLPVNANGRWWEWQCPLEAGQTICQQIVLTQAQAADLERRQAYLMIDCNSAEEITGALTVRLNGQCLQGQVLPALSLAGDFTRFLPVGNNWFEREGEYIYDCMTRSAGIANRDLRQWFLIPLPASALARGNNRPEAPPVDGHAQSGKAYNPLTLTIEITRSGSGRSTIFGGYDTGNNQMIIPGLTLTSWEKPFYGVDCPSGFGDTRYEIKLPGASSPARPDDLSPLPGLQAGRYNIHVLGAPPPRAATAGNIYTVERNSRDIEILKTWTIDLQSLSTLQPPSSGNGAERSFVFKDLPGRTGSDLYLVRLQGQARALSGNPKPGLRFAAVYSNQAGKTSAYIAPWTPRTLDVGKNWKYFDITLPLKPGSLPGNLREIEYRFFPRSNALDAVNPLPAADGVCEFRNTSLQILNMPQNPLGEGHVIY